mgnify:CR=1 FL=1
MSTLDKLQYVSCVPFSGRVACVSLDQQDPYFRVQSLVQSRLLTGSLCRQSAPRESSGRTDYANLHHFSVRVFSVFSPNRKSQNFISYPTILHISCGKFNANSASN